MRIEIHEIATSQRGIQQMKSLSQQFSILSMIDDNIEVINV